MSAWLRHGFLFLAASAAFSGDAPPSTPLAGEPAPKKEERPSQVPS